MHLPSVLLLVACHGGDTGIVAGEPRLREPPSSIDFGEVAVGREARATLTLHDDGIGDLHLQTSWSGDDDVVVLEAPDVVPANGDGDVVLSFVPSAEGPHEGVLTLTTDDEAHATVLVAVRGSGVRPDLDVSPDTLWFGDVPSGGTATRVTTLTSTGSGAVHVTSLAFPADEGTAYSWKLADGLDLPLTIEPGTAVALTVTYAPGADAVDGELVVASDDADAPNQPIRLLAGDDGSGAEPPDVQILAPAWGTAWLDSEAFDVDVQAVDPDDAPADLTVLLYLDGKLVGSASPDADGHVRTTLGPYATGAHTLLARAIDPAGAIDEDDVDLDVQSADDLHYTLSGGDSVFEYFSVDDDLTVSVDGAPAYTDADGHQTTHAPLVLDAVVGSAIHFVATDANPCRKSVDDLVLHFGTGRSQLLVSAQSASSCPEDADYDPDYLGPWPNDFVDVTAVVDVP